jgi:hypothetical protein
MFWCPISYYDITTKDGDTSRRSDSVWTIPEHKEPIPPLVTDRQNAATRRSDMQRFR